MSHSASTLPDRWVQAARHVCQEARLVLTSLRGGPPVVARGELAQDLMELRDRLQTSDGHINLEEELLQGGKQQEKTEDTDAEIKPPQEDAIVMDEYSQPFLQVVMDPRAAGPQTLVALHAVDRLLAQGSLAALLEAHQQPPQPLWEGIAQGVLSCKFEQTDAAQDEAVEMAIATVLFRVVQTKHAFLQVSTMQDAFASVFTTRQTFSHSAPLSLHFESVLQQFVTAIFENKLPARQACLEFLIHQLLHTPLVGGDGMDEQTRQAQALHDATRVISLRLVRTALEIAYPPGDPTATKDDPVEAALIRMIQDDLCLSLLMTGQAIWAYPTHDDHTSPGFVSLDVLAEICATLSTLWNALPLRPHLVGPMEAIWTGFFTRSLVLLRKRREPTNSLSYNANLIFDAEIEIILESLVDILCLHNHSKSIADSDGGALETIFVQYDGHLRRSDVAVGLYVELCRCCGGTVDAEGKVLLPSSHPSSTSLPQLLDMEQDVPSGGGISGGNDDASTIDSPPPSGQQALSSSSENNNNAANASILVEHPLRQVPAHLKELCAAAIMGGMKCLFRDDKASAETLLERSQRSVSIMMVDGGFADEDNYYHPESSNENVSPDHTLRDIKTQKRLTRKAARIFNQKASRGLEFLVDAGILEEPVTPLAVAQFLRNGIVVGLDKKAVGAYLGEAGKAPVAGKSPPTWERDWFHKECLSMYCSLFRFEKQSLLDGLRMFLAAFRLPGEAQQIDRILQAFADRCAQVCEEAPTGRLALFSNDPKRASDAAYLLSFSIIMLNTDLHNDNIRGDRKMKLEDFIRNNTDYGRDITEKGKELPPEYLESIYESIKEEEIRTEGEGAQGAMTVERWKDVLRTDESITDELHPSLHDAEDLTELVLEHVWKPIMSAIGAFWNVTRSSMHSTSPRETSAMHHTSESMLGVQGARLGMDMSLEMLTGVRQLGRFDIFRKIFSWVCYYSGLLGNYQANAAERSWALMNSVEAQSAVVVALRAALEAGDHLDVDGWRRVWSILFELRDLKVLPRFMKETDDDLLSEAARRDWNMCLIKGDMEYNLQQRRSRKNTSGQTGLLGSFGRAFFGSAGLDEESFHDLDEGTVHGKEEFVVWNEAALSDDDDGDDQSLEASLGVDVTLLSCGALFEAQLIRESLDMSRRADALVPVTGLERADETRNFQKSPRARVRRRLQQLCNWEALVSDSRFLTEQGLSAMMESLVSLINSPNHITEGLAPAIPSREASLERTDSSDISVSTPVFIAKSYNVPVSPASEALAEVLICEIALRNRARLKYLWTSILQEHYLSKLTRLLVKPPSSSNEHVLQKVLPDPGLEKRVTGLLRLSQCALQRGEIANEILSSWKYLLPMTDDQHASSPLRVLHRHIGAGVWRMASNVDDLLQLDESGWEGLLSLFNWCSKRGCTLNLIQSNANGLPDDDPSLQIYKSLHLLLNTADLDAKTPIGILDSLRLLIAAGDMRNYPQLCIAALDLIHLLYERKTESVRSDTNESTGQMWHAGWRRIVEAIAEAAERPRFSVSTLLTRALKHVLCLIHLRSFTFQNVRQHALSMLTDIFVDKHDAPVPIECICSVLSEVCVPLAGRSIIRLQAGHDGTSSTDELMIEFELCIGLVFKPLRHNLKHVFASNSSNSNLLAIWRAVLAVIEELLGTRNNVEGDTETALPESLRQTMQDLATEHLHNAIKVLMSYGAILSEPKASNDLSSLTWDSVGRMGIGDETIKSWKASPTDNGDSD